MSPSQQETTNFINTLAFLNYFYSRTPVAENIATGVLYFAKGKCKYLCCRVQHILGKDAVAAGGIAHKDVGDGADELAVLDNGAAAHECVNIVPTCF